MKVKPKYWINLNTDYTVLKRLPLPFAVIYHSHPSLLLLKSSNRKQKYSKIPFGGHGRP